MDAPAAVDQRAPPPPPVRPRRRPGGPPPGAGGGPRLVGHAGPQRLRCGLAPALSGGGEWVWAEWVPPEGRSFRFSSSSVRIANFFWRESPKPTTQKWVPPSCTPGVGQRVPTLRVLSPVSSHILPCFLSQSFLDEAGRCIGICRKLPWGDPLETDHPNFIQDTVMVQECALGGVGTTHCVLLRQVSESFSLRVNISIFLV